MKVFLFVVSPRPSCPEQFNPQPNTVPFSARIIMWKSLATICLITFLFRRVGTTVNVFLFALSLRPNCLEKLCPQLNNVPSYAMTIVYFWAATNCLATFPSGRVGSAVKV